MKTEHIIENLLDWKRTWKPTGVVRLTIEAAIGELQFAENKLRLVVSRQNELIQRLKEERDEAIERLQELEKPREKTRAYWVDVKWKHKFPYKLPQKKENRHND